MTKNVLILCPPFSDQGGVAYYYSLVKKHFESERVFISYYHTGKDFTKNINRILKSLYDLVSLVKIYRNYDLIVLNPSLDPRAVIRDGIFHFCAKRIFQRRTLILFHGWLPNLVPYIDRFGKRFFRYMFQADKILVLSKKFRESFILWGFDPATVAQESTVYEEHGFEVEKDRYKIIFLSRFVEEKGCLEAIQTVQALAKEFPGIKLYMAGDGEMASSLKDYVIRHNLTEQVEFTGYLSGHDKYHLLAQCGIMLYPTNYGEGMPISVLEGMGMGCVVLTRPVAGIQDIISEGKNGFLVSSLDPNDFAIKVKFLLEHSDIWKAISRRSTMEARDRFEVTNVVKRLEKLYFEVAQ